MEAKLSKSDIDKAVAWFNEKQALGVCPICSNRNWQMADILVMAPQFYGGGINIGPGIPMVVVFCTNCTFIRLHSAVLMGLVPPDEPTTGTAAGG